MAAVALDMASAKAADSSAALMASLPWSIALWLRGAGAALAAAALAALIGAALALARPPRRGRWLALAALAPLAIPPTAYGLGWGFVWPAGETALSKWVRLSVVMGLAFAPLTAFAALWAGAIRDPAETEAARLAGLARLARLARIEWPRLRAPLLLGACSVFLLCLAQFEIPAALNTASFAEAVYAQFMQTYSIASAAGLSFAGALAGAALGCLAWRRIGRAPREANASNAWRTMFASGRWPWIFWGGYSALAGLPPLAGLASRGMNAMALRSVAPDLAGGLADSLAIGAIAAALCLLLGWALAGCVRQGGWLGHAALALAVAPMCLPPAVLGVGVIRFWSQPVWAGAVYGRNGAPIAALIARFLPVALFAALAARGWLGGAFEDAGRLSGLGGWRRHTRLLAPAAAPILFAAFAGLLALMMGELGATTLLSAPGTQLLSYRLHSLIHIAPEGQVAALSWLYSLAMLALFALLAAAATARIGARRSR